MSISNTPFGLHDTDFYLRLPPESTYSQEVTNQYVETIKSFNAQERETAQRGKPPYNRVIHTPDQVRVHRERFSQAMAKAIDLLDNQRGDTPTIALAYPMMGALDIEPDMRGRFRRTVIQEPVDIAGTVGTNAGLATLRSEIPSTIREASYAFFVDDVIDKAGTLTEFVKGRGGNSDRTLTHQLHDTNTIVACLHDKSSAFRKEFTAYVSHHDDDWARAQRCFLDDEVMIPMNPQTWINGGCVHGWPFLDVGVPIQESGADTGMIARVASTNDALIALSKERAKDIATRFNEYISDII